MKKWLVRNGVWVCLKGVILEKMVKEELCVGNCCNDNYNVYCIWCDWLYCNIFLDLIFTYTFGGFTER